MSAAIGFRGIAAAFVFAAAGGALAAEDPPVVGADTRIASLEKAVAANPGSLRNMLQLAAAYIQKTRETSDFGYLDRADRIVSRALAASAGDYEARGLRNLIELNRHHFAKVVEYAGQMTETLPADPQNWGVLGDALMELGRYEEAGQAYKRMVAIRPNIFSYNRVAYFKFVTGDAAGAIEAMTRALEDSRAYPENRSWCMVELGNLYLKSGHIEDAQRMFERAMATFPIHTAHAGMGAALAAQDKIAGAIESYLRAWAMVPAPQYAAALADLYAASGDSANARRQRELVDLADRLERAASQKANRTLALIFANQDRQLTHALELAQADWEVRRDVYTYDALAWTLYKNKRYREAKDAVEKALARGTPEPLFHYHAGMIARALGDMREAVNRLEAALQLNPRFDYAQSMIARRALAGVSGQ